VARLIDGRYCRDVYPQVLEDLRRRGQRRPSRNGLTYALDDYTIHVESPLFALPTGCGRGLNARIAAAEAIQLIGGFSDPDWLVGIAPSFKKFLEPNGHFWGAYGERVADQLDFVVDKLRDDPWSRQAVVTLWSSHLDNHYRNKADYPCTVALGFSLGPRHDSLNMRVTMRSNDAWLGLPYDMFQFTQLQLTLANVLGVVPGTYTHTAWSMHLYHEHVNLSYQVTDRAGLATEERYPDLGIGHDGDSFDDVRQRARAIRNGSVALPTDSERWYLDTFADLGAKS